MPKPTLLVLAAGMGTRYGGLKQMDPMGPDGETIIDYSIYDAIRAGFGKVVFVIRPDFADDFKSQVSRQFESKIEVDYAFQELTTVPKAFKVPSLRQKPWGTGHAILVAREKINTPFAAINADDFYGSDAFRTMAEHLQSGTKDLTCMVGYTLNQTLSKHGSVSRGICELDGDSNLIKVVEHLNIEASGGGAVAEESGKKIVLAGDEVVSMNFWGFSPSFFDHLEKLFESFLARHGLEENSEFYIPFAVDELIQKGIVKARVLRTSARWQGVTYPQDKEQVQIALKALVHENLYPSPLWD